MSFQTECEAGCNLTPEDWVMVVVDDQLMLFEDSPVFPFQFLADIDVDHRERHYLGLWLAKPCYLVWVEPQGWPASFTATGLRQLLGRVDRATFALASRALQIVHWLDHHRFCGRCGNANRRHQIERAFVCDACEAYYYPRISPCVIGLVWREKQVLLARNARFRSQYFSVLAGFIEPAETAEGALAREVKEEVSVDILAPQYVCSQPWPFPSQLMLGYFAEYASGEIEVDGQEIVEAAWFDYDRLPEVPPKETISGILIRKFVDRCR